MSTNSHSRKTEDLVLGVDAGGSKTAVVVTDLRGVTLLDIRQRGCHWSQCGIKNYIQYLEGAVLNGINNLGFCMVVNQMRFRFSCFGISGISHWTERRLFAELLKNGRLSNYLEYMPLVVNDTRLAFREYCPSREGIVVIAGTGSNLFGRKGQLAIEADQDADFIDETGNLIFNRCCGYRIGLSLLQSAILREEKTLTESVRSFLRVNSTGLIEYLVRNANIPQKIAFLAPILADLQFSQSPKALEIVRSAADDLLKSVMLMAEKLNFDSDENFEIGLSGGIFKIRKLQEAVVCLLREKFPQAVIVLSGRDPVWGAVSLALDSVKELINDAYFCSMEKT